MKRLLLILPLLLTSCVVVDFEEAQAYFNTRSNNELCRYLRGEVNNAYAYQKAGMDAVRQEFISRGLKQSDCDEYRRKANLAFAAMIQDNKERQQAKKEKALKAKRDAEQAKYRAYITNLKSQCVSYGFEGDNAIATCVQREINLEKDRLQQQPIIVQQSSGPNYDALSNYGRCLGTQGETFSSCSNAWQGYTPPRKTVTKCRYDAFGNVITGTCTTQ